MNQQSSRIVQDAHTALEPADVLAHAKRFFAQQNGIYSAFFEKEGPTHAVFRGQGGEELVIGVAAVAGGTLVTGSSYLFDQQIARFFTSMPPYLAPEVPELAAGVPGGASVDALDELAAAVTAPGGAA